MEKLGLWQGKSNTSIATSSPDQKQVGITACCQLISADGRGPPCDVMNSVCRIMFNDLTLQLNVDTITLGKKVAQGGGWLLWLAGVAVIICLGILFYVVMERERK